MNKESFLPSVSQGQVVFDAQGSRMAMTLIEQLQGKNTPMLSSHSCCIAESVLSSKLSHSSKKSLVTKIHHVSIDAPSSFQCEASLFGGGGGRQGLHCDRSRRPIIAHAEKKGGRMQECVDCKLCSNWAQAIVLSRFWKWHPICHQ